ncbi:hypothetical protein EV356DRAFT_449036 [Viridothelium virens]|uniref:Altered inheritance of mitochondria protein 32 n=1 Tax=Viridothelium virens TaxID=1048519 RepID=A0A6A6H5G0_VIRVR|nr:hypothetical protein EV356DRAFT_449036 [Viridothelium virens]
MLLHPFYRRGGSCLRHWPTARSRLTNPRIVGVQYSSTRTPPFPIVDTCPSPICACRETPRELDIDQKLPLNNTIARYTEQVLISTGKEDWTSRIEDEEDNALARGLKSLLSRGGRYTDPSFNVAITNSSFPPTTSSPTQNASAFTFPSFKYIPTIPNDPQSIESFLKAFLLPEHAPHGTLPSQDTSKSARSNTSQSDFKDVVSVKDIVVLICGHGGRDQRCGILGPLLRDEFLTQLPQQDAKIQAGPPEAKESVTSPNDISARVGLISHIGGHKFAGNVIIYTPPSMGHHPLAGTGIWYGRIEPQHVEGLVKETILGGRVIKEKFRGGISRTEGMLNL